MSANVNLSDAKVRTFWEVGFTTIESLIDTETVAAIRKLYDQFMDGTIECGDDFGKLGGVTRHVMYPQKHHPYFKDNPAIVAAKSIARKLSKCENPELTYDMLITKPPRHAKETPWHQDYAYAQTPVVPAGTKIPNQTLQFWVALDDVDLSNGCMCFVPKVHSAPLLEHVVYSGDPMDKDRMLAIRHPSKVLDLTQRITCPLKAGGCTIHFDGTPHFTPGNTTEDRQRRAYIFNLNVFQTSTQV
jgi:ectoine hydroxylase-related dioxygenase (phytanoyl-CoA dioxygenase family)